MENGSSKVGLVWMFLVILALLTLFSKFFRNCVTGFLHSANVPMPWIGGCLIAGLMIGGMTIYLWRTQSPMFGVVAAIVAAVWTQLAGDRGLPHFDPATTNAIYILKPTAVYVVGSLIGFPIGRALSKGTPDPLAQMRSQSKTELEEKPDQQPNSSDELFK